MNTSFQKSVTVKPLSIDFDLHTDGDEEFKHELVVLMIDNVKELQESLQKSIKQNDMAPFREVTHKVKPTIGIINDQELIDIIEELKQQTDESKKSLAASSFNRICEELIKGLEEELK